MHYFRLIYMRPISSFNTPLRWVLLLKQGMHSTTTHMLPHLSLPDSPEMWFLFCPLTFMVEWSLNAMCDSFTTQQAV